MYRLISLFLLLFTVIVLFSPGPAAAEKMTIVTPYAGEIENVYVDPDRGLDLVDSSMLRGIYVQQVDPDVEQWNLFLYDSDDLNHSSLFGLHVIYDRYFNRREKTKDVAGIGLEHIELDMNAGASFPPLTNFRMDNEIQVWYLRAGRYFMFDRGMIEGSVLPWVGYEIDKAEGTVSFTNPMMGPAGNIRENFDTDNDFIMAGLNVTARAYHFLHVKLKYLARFGNNEYLDSTNVMVNIYMRRNWGFSYRYKTMEFTSGSNTYNMGGITFVF